MAAQGHLSGKPNSSIVSFNFTICSKLAFHPHCPLPNGYKVDPTALRHRTVTKAGRKRKGGICPLYLERKCLSLPANSP